jgi:hypothetical protein
MLNFIDIASINFNTIIGVLLFVHVYFVIRFCAGNIMTYGDRTDIRKFRDLLIVVFLPFFGYFWVLKTREPN